MVFKHCLIPLLKIKNGQQPVFFILVDLLLVAICNQFIKLTI